MPLPVKTCDVCMDSRCQLKILMTIFTLRMICVNGHVPAFPSVHYCLVFLYVNRI